ncbi:MAG: hypothetical protein LBP59_10325 [Planctomycetaceae bacterium]|jgi:hypothetical protein|nr:hypothetical protein [Planctomycetaceae bacterium]
MSVIEFDLIVLDYTDKPAWKYLFCNRCLLGKLVFLGGKKGWYLDCYNLVKRDDYFRTKDKAIETVLNALDSSLQDILLFSDFKINVVERTDNDKDVYKGTFTEREVRRNFIIDHR